MVRLGLAVFGSSPVYYAHCDQQDSGLLADLMRE